MTCAIVDDEALAIELLADKISAFPQLILIKTYTDPLLALIEISMVSPPIDILFLDIDMPTLSGLELGAKLKQSVKYIVFTTAHPIYAMDAFGIRAQDYLLKPVDPIQFSESMINLTLINQNTTNTFNNTQIFVKSNVKGKLLKIVLDDIILIYVEGHKLFVVTMNHTVETSESLTNMMIRLSQDGRFIRVHKSNLINVDKIILIEGNTIEMVGRYKIPISANYKTKLLHKLGVKY